MGIFSGNTKETDSDFIFSTVQTIHKKEYREMFDRDAFDYIIIDEYIVPVHNLIKILSITLNQNFY